MNVQNAFKKIAIPNLMAIKLNIIYNPNSWTILHKQSHFITNMFTLEQ